MFTGLISHTGRVRTISENKGGKILAIQVDTGFPDLATGDSLAVDGACLTLVERSGDILTFALSPHSCALTTLGSKTSGERLNLELPLSLEKPLGGHLLQGHIDGRARIVSKHMDGDCQRFIFTLPSSCSLFVVLNGYIAIDGISLTVVCCDNKTFGIVLIQESAKRVSLAAKQEGAMVNIECDMMAKYLWNFYRHYKDLPHDKK